MNPESIRLLRPVMFAALLTVLGVVYAISGVNHYISTVVVGAVLSLAGVSVVTMFRSPDSNK